jgi:DNA polymerase IV
MSNLSPAEADAELEDLEPAIARKAKAERAMDGLREKFGLGAVEKGLSFQQPAPDLNAPQNPPDWMDED